MRKIIAGVVGVLSLWIGAESIAAASSTYWSSNAASCTPGDPAIQNNLYTVVAGSVGFGASKTGRITLYCRVPVINATSPLLMILTYRDADGTATNNNVTAQLLRMSMADGSISTISGATIDSNTVNSTASTNASTLFGHTFDFDNFYYYVRVDLVRVDSSVTETFYGVVLRTAPTL